MNDEKLDTKTDDETGSKMGRPIMYGDGVETEQKRITLPAEMWRLVESEFAEHKRSAASVGIHSIVKDWEKRQRRKKSRQQKAG